MFNLNKIVRNNILSLKAYSSARNEYDGISATYFDANESPFGRLNRYPDPFQTQIKQKLSIIKSIDSSNIFLGNGSDEVIDLAFRIFCEPKLDKVLIFNPTYGMYKVSANINDVEIINIPLLNNFQLNIEKSKEILSDDKLKMIFICSPNNPTANLMNKSDIEYLLNNFAGIVFVDEAYIDFSQTDSWINRLEKYPNLIVSQTFSKAWGLAAARVGVGYAGKEIIDLFNKIKPPYNISKLNQEEIILALDEKELLKLNVQTILQEKNKLEKEFQNIPFIKKVYPSDSNFLLIEVDNPDEIYQKLIDKKIIIRNRSELIQNCLRITVGLAEENNLLIKSLQEII